MRLTDELLLAYADGLLDQERASEVDRALAQDAEARERLRLMRLSGEALARAKDAVTSEGSIAALEEHIRNFGVPVEEAKAAQRRASASARSIFWRMAAGIVFLAVGLVGGVLLAPMIGPLGPSGDELPEWIESVADYQSLYARVTLENTRMSDTERSAFEAAVENILQLDRSIAVPDLSEMGLEFKRGQVLDYDDWPLIQLLYLPTGSGEPLALCFRRRERNDADVVHYMHEGIGIARWIHNGLELLVVGKADESTLTEAADLASLQL